MENVMTYRRKPVDVEAVQYFREENIGEVLDWLVRNEKPEVLTYHVAENEYSLTTSVGKVRLAFGDFIVKDAEGEFYVCKQEVFSLEYEALEKDVEEYKIKQCCTCGKVFAKHDGKVCPVCFSGNWVYGYIDKPKVEVPDGK
jgi:hypothetical protein